jgi:hypothetical protein
VGVFYLCLHTVGLVRVEVVWVCFVLYFGISLFVFTLIMCNVKCHQHRA